MDSFTREEIKTALSIFSAALTNGSLDTKSHSELVRRYEGQVGVRECLDLICSELRLYSWSYDGGLYLSAGIGNTLFGFSNEDMRNEFKQFNNPEVYAAMFIMHVIVIEFYPEATRDTVPFISMDDILTTTKEKVSALEKLENIDEISKEYAFNFGQVAKKLAKRDAVLKKDSEDLAVEGKSTLWQYIHRVTDFMERHSLITVSNNRIYPTDRFKAVVWEAYNNEDVRWELSEYIGGLCGDNDGENDDTTVVSQS